MNESAVTAKLRIALTAEGILAWKTSDRFHGGRPDLTLCYRGRFGAIEAKIHPAKPTDLQRHCLNEIVTAGGMAMTMSYHKQMKTFTFTDVATNEATTFGNAKESAQWVSRQLSSNTRLNVSSS